MGEPPFCLNLTSGTIIDIILIVACAYVKHALASSRFLTANQEVQELAIFSDRPDNRDCGSCRWPTRVLGSSWATSRAIGKSCSGTSWSLFLLLCLVHRSMCSSPPLRPWRSCCSTFEKSVAWLVMPLLACVPNYQVPGIIEQQTSCRTGHFVSSWLITVDGATRIPPCPCYDLCLCRYLVQSWACCAMYWAYIRSILAFVSCVLIFGLSIRQRSRGFRRGVLTNSLWKDCHIPWTLVKGEWAGHDTSAPARTFPHSLACCTFARCVSAHVRKEKASCR